jgi:TolB-like protein/tetratricopeptide (TPR) repeat protein
MGEGVYKFANLELDKECYELRRSGHVIRLERIPMDLLFLMVENRGQLLTRDQIVAKLWNPDVFFDSEHGVNTAIHKIRQALGDSAARPRFIETVVGKGYRFIGKISLAAPDGAQARHPVRTPSGKKKVMLAVLPFVNMSGDLEQEFFSDGLTEELISQLGGFNPEHLGVIARTSSMTYKGTSKSAQQIGGELDVKYILEGSVRRTPTRIRITAQLVETEHASHLWSQSYNRELGDVLAVQDEVAQAITGHILQRLPQQEKGKMPGSRRIAPEAHEAYLKGRFHLNRLTDRDLRKALDFFRQAITCDPKMAPAYAGLSETYMFLEVLNDLPPHEARGPALEAAERALLLYENLAEGYEAIGNVHSLCWEWERAGSDFRRAIELNPSSADAHRFRGVQLMETGQTREGIEEMLEARRLDPLSLIINAEVVRNYYFARQYGKAIGHGLATLEMDPHFARAHFWLGRTYEQTGLLDKAIAELRQAAELSPDSLIYRGDLAHAFALAGRRAEATEILNGMESQAGRQYVSSYTIAVIHTALGNISAALARLEKAFEDRSWMFMWLGTDPRLDRLRPLPEFQGLMRRVGL